jgi:phosphatidylglycerol---prolipoprotein diacylglyceryl transferase
MIPYIHVPDLHLGPVPLHPFGILVATGVLLGTAVTTRRARTLGYDLVKLNSFVTWMLVTAFVLSHVLDSLFYHWDEVVKRPWSVIMLWEGLSSFGGFVGALLGIVLWKYFYIDGWVPRMREKPHPILPFADLVMSVLPLGWMFGRAGCSSVHDHLGATAAPGTWVAVEAPLDARDENGVHLGPIELIHGHHLRFDLGLLELMFTVLLTICFALTWRRRLPLGSYVVATALAYSPVRFAMDFLRIPQSEGGDTRYAGLTPAQYGCVALFLFGIAMIFYMRSLKKRGVDLVQSVLAQVPEPAAPSVPSASPTGS